MSAFAQFSIKVRRLQLEEEVEKRRVLGDALHGLAQEHHALEKSVQLKVKRQVSDIKMLLFFYSRCCVTDVVVVAFDKVFKGNECFEVQLNLEGSNLLIWQCKVLQPALLQFFIARSF